MVHPRPPGAWRPLEHSAYRRLAAAGAKRRLAHVDGWRMLTAGAWQRLAPVDGQRRQQPLAPAHPPPPSLPPTPPSYPSTHSPSTPSQQVLLTLRAAFFFCRGMSRRYHQGSERHLGWPCTRVSPREITSDPSLHLTATPAFLPLCTKLDQQSAPLLGRGVVRDGVRGGVRGGQVPPPPRTRRASRPIVPRWICQKEFDC